MRLWIPPALRIYPGDTVRSRTYDTTGRDAKIPHGMGGNPETGPFYIEGAIPGDTLMVKLNLDINIVIVLFGHGGILGRLDALWRRGRARR